MKHTMTTGPASSVKWSWGVVAEDLASRRPALSVPDGGTNDQRASATVDSGMGQSELKGGTRDGALKS